MLEVGSKICTWSMKSSDHVAAAPSVMYERAVATFFSSSSYIVQLTPRYAVIFLSHLLDLVRSLSNSSTLSLSSTGRAVAMFTGDGGCVDAGELGGLGVIGGAGAGVKLTGFGNTTGGTGFARLTAARWGVIPVCCCSLQGGYGRLGYSLMRKSW